jgi:hypothetical protein
MAMTPELKKKIQLVLMAATALAAGRTTYILYQRHAEKVRQQANTQASALDPDYYVTPKKLYPYDLKSARQLTQQPVWVKEGYRYSYYSYDRGTRRADFSREVGQLLPIEKLQIQDVVTDVTPGAADQRQIMAVFDKDGKSYAFPVGSVKGSSFQIYSDEMLYIEDPRALYKHWPAEVWDAIEKHQVKPGMNEIQADFAVGMGIPQRSDDPAVKTVNYPNGGKSLRVTYRNGKAAEIGPGPAAELYFTFGESASAAFSSSAWITPSSSA